jgi:two-component sensor histidine kinase
MPLVVMGRAPWRTEIESRGVCLSVRAVPLTDRGQRIGAVLMCRDVSELRRRERELITKDATIREIHHRVKNNLQTVAALLRLQARRMGSADAKAALEEAVRRVGSIAIVHETLSHAVEETVDFDEIADRLGSMVVDVSGVEVPVRVVREGSFGKLPSEAATPLAMVLTELLQNAVEHGYAYQEVATVEHSGRVVVTARRIVGRLHVVVEDDGRGLPDDFDLDSSTQLGLSIVRTLVESELGGVLEIGPGSRGTRVQADLPVD